MQPSLVQCEICRGRCWQVRIQVVPGCWVWTEEKALCMLRVRVTVSGQAQMLCGRGDQAADDGRT